MCVCVCVWARVEKILKKEVIQSEEFNKKKSSRYNVSVSIDHHQDSEKMLWTVVKSPIDNKRNKTKQNVCVCGGLSHDFDVWAPDNSVKDMNCGTTYADDLFILVKVCIEPATLFG